MWDWNFVSVDVAQVCELTSSGGRLVNFGIRDTREDQK